MPRNHNEYEEFAVVNSQKRKILIAWQFKVAAKKSAAAGAQFDAQHLFQMQNT